MCDRFGHRLSGSAALEKAIDWVADKMANEDGLEVTLDGMLWLMGSDGGDDCMIELLVPKFVRGNEYAYLYRDGEFIKEMAILGLGGSGNTGGEVLNASVVVVDSFDELQALDDSEVEGKIVMYNAEYVTYGEYE